jgi:hypothetical protein
MLKEYDTSPGLPGQWKEAPSLWKSLWKLLATHFVEAVRISLQPFLSIGSLTVRYCKYYTYMAIEPDGAKRNFARREVSVNGFCTGLQQWCYERVSERKGTG